MVMTSLIIGIKITNWDELKDCLHEILTSITLEISCIFALKCPLPIFNHKINHECKLLLTGLCTPYSSMLGPKLSKLIFRPWTEFVLRTTKLSFAFKYPSPRSFFYCP